MKKILFVCLITLCNYSVAGTFTSAGAGPADFLTPASWIAVGDADGIPDSDDDVTISAGHTITLSGARTIRNLTVDGTIQFNFSGDLTINGDYTVNGAQTGVGNINFGGTSTTKNISGAGAFSAGTRWVFGKNRTIASNVVSFRTAKTRINAGIVVTNNGSMGLRQMELYTGATWIQGANSSLTLSGNSITFFTGVYASTGTFNATATGNTVTIGYNTCNIPTAVSSTYYNLVIAGTTASIKTMLANTTVLNNLTINSNQTLRTNNFDLTVGGNWSSNGIFTASTGREVLFNGTAAQTVSNTVGTTTFTELEINNNSGVTLTSGTYVLDEILTVTDGTFNTGGRPFTMTSTATRTARIAPIVGAGAIAGNFTIQRFITSRDTTYTDLSSPVQGTSFSDWESELNFVNYTHTPPTSYASAYTYDEAADEYVPVTSAGSFLAPGQGFEVYLSGGSYSNFPATTLNTVGVPNQGDHDLSSSVSNTVQGWNLVGNPFASSVSWSSIYTASGGASSGMYDYFEMYDYTIADWNGFTSADGVEIGSTQGFWVYGLSGPMTLLIPESAKTTSSNSSLRNASAKPQFFNLKLSNTTSKFAHNFKVAASESFSDGLDPKDIPFRNSLNKTTPEMYCEIDGKKININSFNSLNETYSIPLKTKASVAGSYKIEASGFEFLDYACITLQDNLTGQTVDLTDGNGYCFTMNTTETPDRFILLMTRDAANCRSSIASSPSVNFSNQVEILPAAGGNVVNFNLAEITNTNISVVNVLGQTVVESINVDAANQSVNIAIPEDFSGLYFIKVESAKGTITKKFVRK